MTSYVSSSYSLSSVMFSYILAQMPRHSLQPVEHTHFATGTAQSVTSHLSITSHYFQQRFRSNIHVTLHGHQFTLYPPVDADVDQALIPPSYLHLNQGTHGGYGTRQLMMSEEGFPAAQNLYWLPSDDSASISVYIVCHPLHLCACILVLLLLRLICQRV